MQKANRKTIKMKVRKSLLKRFKVTSKGKLLRGPQMGGHRKFHKSRRQKQSYRDTLPLTIQQAAKIKQLI